MRSEVVCLDMRADNLKGAVLSSQFKIEDKDADICWWIANEAVGWHESYASRSNDFISAANTGWANRFHLRGSNMLKRFFESYKNLFFITIPIGQFCYPPAVHTLFFSISSSITTTNRVTDMIALKKHQKYCARITVSVEEKGYKAEFYSCEIWRCHF